MSEAEDRTRRLEQALRDNLRRRKAQARGAVTPPAGDPPAADPSPTGPTSDVAPVDRVAG